MKRTGSSTFVLNIPSGCEDIFDTMNLSNARNLD